MEGNKIAIDLGGTFLRTALVQDGKIIKYIKKRTPKTSKELVDELINSVRELKQYSESRVNFIGIGSAGPLDNKKGIIMNPPNLPFKNFNLKKAIEKEFKIRTEIENDANCAALAESRFGYKKSNFVLLTLGTGIGGGVILENKIYIGQGYGGELGHIVLDNGKDLETLWKQHKVLSKKYFGKELLINDLFKLRDKKAKEILGKISMCLGQGIASLINIFDPEIVILSGGVKETGNKFLKMIEKNAKKYIALPRAPPIKWTKLKHPGILGAGLLGEI